ncbi:MAG: hypothetical protein AAF649_05325 [Verrucomicrobiota bacterium]
MDRQTCLILLALGMVGGCTAFSLKRTQELKKARAVRESLRPRYKSGCFLVKITEGPTWAVGEFGTYDAEDNSLVIEGDEYPADEFQFILA